MLVGCQPFRGDAAEDVQNAIKKGEYVFDEGFWKNVNEKSKNLSAHFSF